MNFNEFAAKKVLGVPILYLIGAAVAILVVVAWKMKPSKPDAVDETPVDAADVGGETADPYDDFETKGTVIVQPTVPNPDPNLSNQSIETNQQWVTKGTTFLLTENKASGTEAASALNKYLTGQDRSYEEDILINLVIKELGPPPDGSDQGGTTGPKPVGKQFTGAGTHTVQGTSDNTASSLASLYYNSNAQDRVDLIEAANVGKGGGPWATGAKITVPEYTVPKFYITPASGYLSAKNLAAKQGVSLDKLALLNNPAGGIYNPEYRFGPNSRVRIA